MNRTEFEQMMTLRQEKNQEVFSYDELTTAPLAWYEQEAFKLMFKSAREGSIDALRGIMQEFGRARVPLRVTIAAKLLRGADINKMLNKMVRDFTYAARQLADMTNPKDNHLLAARQCAALIGDQALVMELIEASIDPASGLKGTVEVLDDTAIIDSVMTQWDQKTLQENDDPLTRHEHNVLSDEWLQMEPKERAQAMIRKHGNGDDSTGA